MDKGGAKAERGYSGPTRGPRGSTSGRRSDARKPYIVCMASAAGHCRREKPGVAYVRSHRQCCRLSKLTPM